MQIEEQPNAGRAIITERLNQIEIVIPVKRNVVFIISGSVLFLVWLGGISSMLNSLLTEPPEKDLPPYFPIIMLLAWTTVLIQALRILLWTLKGKEIITAGEGMLCIRKEFALFRKPRNYDLTRVANVRIAEDNYDYMFQFHSRKHASGILDSGSIHFDYGMKTVRFGQKLTEDEADYVVQRMISAGIITSQHLAPIT